MSVYEISLSRNFANKAQHETEWNRRTVVARRLPLLYAGMQRVKRKTVQGKEKKKNVELLLTQWLIISNRGDQTRKLTANANRRTRYEYTNANVYNNNITYTDNGAPRRAANYARALSVFIPPSKEIKAKPVRN